MIHRQNEPHYVPKAELLLVLRRIGVSEATIAEIGSQLPERVDIDESGAMLQQYGLTKDEAISRLGGSP